MMKKILFVWMMCAVPVALQAQMLSMESMDALVSPKDDATDNSADDMPPPPSDAPSALEEAPPAPPVDTPPPSV